MYSGLSSMFDGDAAGTLEGAGTQVLQIAREALSNVGRHAAASSSRPSTAA